MRANYDWAHYRAQRPERQWFFPVGHPWWRRQVACRVCGARFRPCDHNREKMFAGPAAPGRPKMMFSPEMRALLARFAAST